MFLLPLLTEQARRRNLWCDATLSVESVFALVRDMPYQRASSRQPDTIIREWRGTCSGKHYLLRALLEELGYEARLMICTHRFTQENCSHFPEPLRSQLASNPIPDVHNFVRLKTFKGWMDVDATWPLGTQRLGMPVNEKFELGVNMRIACEPVEIFEIPKSANPQAFKDKLVQEFCEIKVESRDRFIETLSAWLNLSQNIDTESI